MGSRTPTSTDTGTGAVPGCVAVAVCAVELVATASARADRYEVVVADVGPDLLHTAGERDSTTPPARTFDLLDSGGGSFRFRTRAPGWSLTVVRHAQDAGTSVLRHPTGTGEGPAEWLLRSTRHECSARPACARTGPVRTVVVHRLRTPDADPAGGRPLARAVLRTWDCAEHARVWSTGDRSWTVLPPGAVGPVELSRGRAGAAGAAAPPPGAEPPAAAR